MKFINLLKKELAELINKQMILGLLLTLAILMIVGQVMTEAIDTVTESAYSINLMDADDTDFSHEIVDTLKKMEDSSSNKIKLKLIEKSDADYSSLMEKNNLNSLIIIPEGFSEKVEAFDKSAELESVSKIKSASSLGTLNADTSDSISVIQDIVSNKILADKGLSASEIASAETPFKVISTTVVGEKSSAIPMQNIVSNMTAQNTIIPIIIFILVIYTSQMIVSAISTEKIDKTLETLLSAPVSRVSVLGSKMLAAAIVALINAAVYMLGFSKFVSGATSSISSETLDDAMSVSNAMEQLGLKLTTGDYVLIGIQMFLTIMISLSVSIILGAMVNDAKSAQTIIMPIMMCAMIPYIISMLTDINTLNPTIKTLVYAIPFTHTFTAMNNLMFGNDKLFIIGIIYQALLFIICMFFAIRLFNSDKIFTASLNFGQKSKFKKSKKVSE